MFIIRTRLRFTALAPKTPHMRRIWMFFAFSQRNCKCARAEDFHPARLGGVVANVHAAFHVLFKIWRQRIQRFYLIFFFMFVFRVEQSICDAAVFGEDNESRRVLSDRPKGKTFLSGMMFSIDSSSPCGEWVIIPRGL